jgi:hypothetical protein
MRRVDAEPEDRWTHGGGDLESAVRSLAASGKLGAYIEFRIEPLGTFVAGDLASDVRAAWDALIPKLPSGAVARREGWFSLGAVVPGDPMSLVDIARDVMRVLRTRKRTPPYRAAAVLCEVLRDDPEAALMVDVTSALEDVEGDAVGWGIPRRVGMGLPAVDCDVDWIGLEG